MRNTQTQWPKRNDQTFAKKRHRTISTSLTQISPHRRTDLHAPVCELSATRYVCLFFINSTLLSMIKPFYIHQVINRHQVAGQLYGRTKYLLFIKDILRSFRLCHFLLASSQCISVTVHLSQMHYCNAFCRVRPIYSGICESNAKQIENLQ